MLLDNGEKKATRGRGVKKVGREFSIWTCISYRLVSGRPNL